MKQKRLITILVIIGVLVLIYLSGPKASSLFFTTDLPAINVPTEQADKYLKEKEASVPFIKPDNEAQIIWFDSLKKNKTAYCIVYLHGFSSSQGEGIPVHKNIAKRFGCNLYLPRLYAHGLTEQEPLLELTEEKYLESVKEAVAFAKNLGQQIILMGTSTGGTFSLYLASGNPDIKGLILYSPNVDLRDPTSFLLVKPWGLQIAQGVMGGKYYSFTGPAGVEKYWTTRYRIEALVRLKNILRSTMTKENFSKIHQPVLVCYYKKNELEQDDVVSVPAMMEMFGQLATPDSLKRMVNIPNAGKHAIASGIFSKDVESVEKATAEFMEQILRIPEIK
jgi:esterase/lipase